MVGTILETERFNNVRKIRILVRKKNLGIKKHVGTVRKCVLYWYFMQAGNYVIRLDLELN